MLALMVLMQIGGINAVLFYLKDIFLKADTGYSPGLQTVIVSIFQVSSSTVQMRSHCQRVKCVMKSSLVFMILA